jgi:hypothetical protein
MNSKSTIAKKLLAWIITASIFLSACTVQTSNYKNANQAPSNVQQIAISIKQSIVHNPQYQTGAKNHQAKEYTKYINELISQVKQKKISEDYARDTLLKTYRNFKADTFNSKDFKTRTPDLKKDRWLNESPSSLPEEPPPQIPEKPGAL